eukprot:gene13801-biopygen4861
MVRHGDEGWYVMDGTDGTSFIMMRHDAFGMTHDGTEDSSWRTMSRRIRHDTRCHGGFVMTYEGTDGTSWRARVVRHGARCHGGFVMTHDVTEDSSWRMRAWIHHGTEDSSWYVMEGGGGREGSCSVMEESSWYVM